MRRLFNWLGYDRPITWSDVGEFTYIAVVGGLGVGVLEWLQRVPHIDQGLVEDVLRWEIRIVFGALPVAMLVYSIYLKVKDRT